MPKRTDLVLVLALWTLFVPRAAQGDPVSFDKEIQLHYQLSACGQGSQAAVAAAGRLARRHCRMINGLYKRYSQNWSVRVARFFKKHLPPTAPKRVVTPFSGGDLASLLGVFPDATEFTSISLEASGDPRLITRLKGKKLADALADIRQTLKKYYALAHHRTTSLRSHSLSSLTGELSFSVSALRAYGYEPVDLRYFQIASDGTLRYITQKDVDAVDKLGDPVKVRELFSNMELSFRKKGGPLKLYRHLRQDLSNKGFHDGSPLFLHLKQKKAICGVVKAGSYLMPMKMFANIRTFMLQNTTWMVADSTGPSPRQAAAAGLKQQFFGKYKGAFSWRPGSPGKQHDKQRLRVWGAKPYRWLPFRFGYPDNSQNNHLLIYTRK